MIWFNSQECSLPRVALLCFVTLAFGAAVPPAYGDSPTPSVLDLQEHWNNGTAGEFSGVDDVSIKFRTFLRSNHKGSVVICSGRTECMLKYQELIWELGNENYSVFIYDHRGQGLSGRIPNAAPLMGHVETFDDYVADLKVFVDDQVLGPNTSKAESTPLFLLAHSMGGCVVSLYLERNGDHPFSAAVLCSPMHKPDTGLVPAKIAEVVADKKKVIKPTTFASGGPYKDVSFDSISDKRVEAMTHSKERYERIRALYKANPKVTIGGPSYKWASEAIEAAKTSVKDAGKVKVPVLIIQAGDDAAVDNKKQFEFAKRAENCDLVTVEDAYHELLVEEDFYRSQAVTQLSEFFARFIK